MSKICDFCEQEYFGSPTAHVEVCPEPRPWFPVFPSWGGK